MRNNSSNAGDSPDGSGPLSIPFEAGILAAICGLALWLRVSHLSSQGIYFWDEAHYLLHSRTYCNLARWIVHNPSRLLHHDLSGLREVLRNEGGTVPYTAAKPSYALLVGIFYVLCSGRDFSTLFLSALMGTLDVLLLYFCARKLRGQLAALLAAGVAATLGMDVWYSRLGLPCTTVMAFVLAGYYWMLRGENKDRSFLGMGVAFGTAFTVHPLALPSIAALPAFLAVIRRPKAAAWFAFGCVIPAAGWEIAFSIRNAISPWPLISYYREYANQAIVNAAHIGAFRSAMAPFFLRWVVISSGIPALIVLAAGIFLDAFGGRWRKNPFEQAAWVLGPGVLAIWSVGFIFGAQPIARTISAGLPFGMLLAACGWDAAVRRLFLHRIASYRAAMLATIVIVMVVLGFRSKSYLRLRSPYPALSDFFREHPGRFISTCDPITQFYFPETRFRGSNWKESGEPPENFDSLRYLALDWIVYYSLPSVPGWVASAMQRPPVARFDYHLPDYRLILYESDPTRCEPRFQVWGTDFQKEVRVYGLIATSENAPLR